MRRLLVPSILTMALITTFAPNANGAGPLPIATVNEEGRVVAHKSAVIDVPAGSLIVVQKLVLQPGFSGLWPATTGDTLIAAKRGSVTTLAGCTDRQMWEAGHGYLRRPGDGPADLLVKNEGSEPAELIVVLFNAASTVEPTAATCAPRGTFSATEMARVVNSFHDTLEMDAGKQVVIQSFLVEPGFNFFWHVHPGPTLQLQKAGTTTEYMGCTHRLVWQPGYGYIHTPGHHGREKMTAKNEGKETSELLSVWFNVPEWHPAPLVPRNVEPPPTGCPTRSII
jgi:hypothetical protein